MHRSISVFGLGYAGSVAAGCLADLGHRVIGVDVNPAKVELVEAGRSPVVEPGLEALIARGREADRLRATTDATLAVRDTDVSFMCVGTPRGHDGSLDLAQVRSCSAQIGEGLRHKSDFHLIALRSTVLPGTTERVVVPGIQRASGLSLGDFGVCVNPEFMREGSGVADFREPELIVIGAQDAAHGELLREIYTGIPGRVFETTFATAEMIKFVGNAWHALKVCFANEVGSLAKRLQVDVPSLLEMFLADTKLNVSAEYMRPGFAFGGSCLPKDLSALTDAAADVGLSAPLLEAVLPSNEQHLQRAVDLARSAGKTTFAVLGLSFKENTDDLRDSPQVELVKRLVADGYGVRIWAPEVSIERLIGANREYIASALPEMSSLLVHDMGDAVTPSEVVVIASRGVELHELQHLLRPEQIVVDLVNLERSRRVGDPASYEGLC